VIASLDWSKLPRELKWLAIPAERYWRLREDSAVDDFLQRLRALLFASSSPILEVGSVEYLSRRAALDEQVALQEWARGWGFCGDLIEEWLEAHPATEHPEAERVRFLADLFGRAEQAGLM
jgi:hypothetical protein